jgi:5-deoxy-glucuronate isomerase
MMNPYGNEYFETVNTQPGANHLANNACRLLDFELVVLNPGDEHAVSTGQHELGLVVLTGTVDISVDGQRFAQVGGRATVFAGPPSAVYAPCGAAVTVKAGSKAEVALCSAPSKLQTAAYQVKPEEVTHGKWGQFNTSRTFNFMINQNRPSERLHLAEVTVVSGNWATYPPHKHEDNLPEKGEVYQEEMYFYRTEPADGFGMCALYGGKIAQDYAFIIRNNTIQKMPYGYHTLTAAPGYKIWYLALIAGDTKAASPVLDPHHAWYARTDLVVDNITQNYMR